MQNGVVSDSGTIFSVATPILQGADTVGVVAIASAAGEIDELVRSEREQVLQMFVIAILVSIGLSLVLASTIANPLSDLAAAAELGRDKQRPQEKPGRVRIPDLTGRPDEIGRLSRRDARHGRRALRPDRRATNSSPPTWRTRSRTRWRRCARPSARCGSPSATTSATGCWR